MLALAIAAGVMGPAGAQDRHARTDAEPVRILIVGDSITQGAGGDWTWRYRLAQHLEQAQAPVDFVGRYDVLFDLVTRRQGSTDYLDPDFDRDHHALWGGSYRDVGADIGTVVEETAADVVVNALGVNDLGWHGESVDVVAGRLRTFVQQAREANPDVDLVLAQVPLGIGGKGEAYNARVAHVAAELDSSTSGVRVADPGGFFGPEDTWDGVHPSARGEIAIAAGVADALASLGIGTPYPADLPEVPVGPRVAATVSGTAAPGEVTISWESAPGVLRETMWWRDVTAGEGWQRLPDELPHAGVWTRGGLTNGHVYAVMLQPGRGTLDAAEDVRSTVLLRPMPERLTAPVEDLQVEPTDHGLRVTWAASLGAESYTVWFRGRGHDVDLRSRVTNSLEVELEDLVAGNPYDVWVEAANLSGVGPASEAVQAVPLGPEVGLPGHVVATASSQTTALVTWDPVPEATGYWVQYRPAREPEWWTVGVDAPSTELVLSDLAPGTDYRVRMLAYHQRILGGLSPETAFATPLPRLGAVRRVRARSPRPRRLRTWGGPVAYADGYQLARARARSCRRRPPGRAFRSKRQVHERPAARLRVRAGVHWVRWRAVRGDEHGPVVRRSYACVRVAARASRRTLPVAVIGKASTKVYSLGRLAGAR